MSKSRFLSYLKPLDFVIASAVLLLGLSIWLFPLFKKGSDRLQLSVIADGKESFYSLSENIDISIDSNGYEMTLSIENGDVFVKHAECPDKHCVKMGRISKEGEAILCVPAEVVLRLISEKGENIDAAAG